MRRRLAPQTFLDSSGLEDLTELLDRGRGQNEGRVGDSVSLLLRNRTTWN